MLGYELDPAEVGSDPRCAGVCARTTPRLCRVQGLIGVFTAGFVIGEEQSSTLALTKSPPQRGKLFVGHSRGMLVRTLGMRMQGGLDDPGSPVMVFLHVLRWHLVPVLALRSPGFSALKKTNRGFSEPPKDYPVGARSYVSSQRILALTSLVSC